ncbi:MAG: ABC transporter substrate-binding protein [Chloroflexi bacterium]|nr:ABC transporter substrate-binding protein [Chloroflexota bacterium]
MIALPRCTVWIALALACAVGLRGQRASAQYELRVGVIDYPAGSMLAGARLATDHINDAGGVIGADGTVFRLAVVDTPPDNMEIATANMKQASVFAVIGPEDDEIFRRNIALLQEIQAPVFTPAAGDSALLSDQSGRMYRSRAAESAQFSALADYLANALAIQSIATIHLDTASTTSLISFANALYAHGLAPSPLAFDLSRPNLRQVAASPSAPDAVAIFGAPHLAAQAVVQLRNAGYAGEVVYSRAHEPEFAERAPTESLPGIISLSTWSHTLADPASREFTWAYARAFGRLPDASAAASYDAIQLVAAAAARGGDIYSALSATGAFAGVQGELNPANLPPGEISNNAIVARSNEHGVANVVARYPDRPLVAAPEQTTEQATERAPTLAPPTATPLPTATPTGYHLRTRSRVQNVRSGPGTEYDVIGQVIEGTQARVLGATSDYSWLVIDYRGQWGWMAAYLVDVFGDRNLVPIIQPPATPTPAPTDTPPPPQEPDLLVLEAGPNRLTIGQATALSVTILNQGLSPAGPFAVAATFQPGGQFAGVNLAGLDARQRTATQLHPNLSGPSGPQSIVIVADLNQQVYEGDGEANNQDFVFTYMADRPVLASGTWTTAAGSIDLDGDGNADLSWTGNDLAALGSAAFAAIDQFSTLDQTHYDAVSATTLNSAIASADQLANRVFTLVTADGHRGVMQVTSVMRNGPITVDYRIYR